MYSDMNKIIIRTFKMSRNIKWIVHCLFKSFADISAGAGVSLLLHHPGDQAIMGSGAVQLMPGVDTEVD